MDAGLRLGKCIAHVPGNVSSITGTFREGQLQGRVQIKYFENSKDAPIGVEQRAVSVVGNAKNNRWVGIVRKFNNENLEEVTLASSGEANNMLSNSCFPIFYKLEQTCSSTETIYSTSYLI